MPQTTLTQSVPIPYGIAHPSGAVGCLQTDAEGRFTCIDLRDGTVLARSEMLLNPLLIEKRFLIGWSAVAQGVNRVEIHYLNIRNYQLQTSWRTEVALPDWVLPSTSPSPAFSLRARKEGDLLSLLWEAYRRPSHGAFQSRKADDDSISAGAGKILIRLTDGALMDNRTIPLKEANSETAQRAYQLPRVAYKRTMSVDSTLWTVGSLDLLLVQGDGEQSGSLLLWQWDRVSGRLVGNFRLGGNPDVTPMVSPNGEQIFVPREDALDFFSAVNGKLVATVPNEQDLADIAVVAELVLYRTGEQVFAPEEGRIRTNHGLRVRNTSTGDLLWDRIMYQENMEPPMHFQRS